MALLTSTVARPFVPARSEELTIERTAPAAVKLTHRVVDIETGGTASFAEDPNAMQILPIRSLLVNACAVFVVSLVVSMAFLVSVPVVLGFDSSVVTSGSMEPAIRIADVVVTTASDGEDLAEGVVIRYQHGDDYRLHRIAAVTPDGYTTAGDANRTIDSETVAPSAIAGVGIVVIPYAGFPTVWLATGQWPWLVLIVSGFICALWFARSQWILARLYPLAS